MIRTVDIDGVALVVAAVPQLSIRCIVDCIRDWETLPLHTLTDKVPPCFMCMSTLDATVSVFATKGKKTAWETWRIHPQVTKVFQDRGVGEVWGNILTGKIHTD